jgi:hypothetical protein
MREEKLATMEQEEMANRVEELWPILSCPNKVTVTSRESVVDGMLLKNLSLIKVISPTTRGDFERVSLADVAKSPFKSTIS